jgi:hypothetical protein
MRLLFILLPLLLLAGCTITKRHFGPGYHVEWKKSYSKPEHEVRQLNVTDLGRESSVATDKNEAIYEVIATDTMYRVELISPDLLEISIEEPTGFSENPLQTEIKPVIESDQIPNDEVPVDAPKRRVEPFTWAALSGILLGFFLCLISFLLTSPEIILGIVTGIGILVIVFSIVSVVRIIKHPESYKGKGLTWTLFGLSTVGIGAALFMIVYAILFATGNAGFL